MIEASAPGKLVVSGEYAVLAGAPALVAAVDRRVTCTLSVRDDGGWRFLSTGYEDDVSLAKDAVFRAAPNTLPGIVPQLLGEAAAPAHIEVRIDSTPCQLDGQKLGVGSSAALVAALASAFSVLGGSPPTLAGLYEIHAAFQGGGSGLDVAAAVTGGVIRFQDRRVVPARLPRLHQVFVFVGSSTKTTDLIAKFDAWRDGGTPPILQRLTEAAVEVADCTRDAGLFLDAMREYGDILERLDITARIGIFGAGHRKAREIAGRCGVVYKPCGAGGGDTGIGMAEEPEAAARFADRARDAGLKIVPMEAAQDGIRIHNA